MFNVAMATGLASFSEIFLSPAGDVVVSMEYNPFIQEWAVTQSDQRDAPVEELSQQLQAATV